MSAVHINRPSSTRFVAVARPKGHRNWTTLQGSRSQQKAMAALSRALRGDYYWRGAILLVADYYDPVSILEMRKT